MLKDRNGEKRGGRSGGEAGEFAKTLENKGFEKRGELRGGVCGGGWGGRRDFGVKFGKFRQICQNSSNLRILVLFPENPET